MKKVLFVFGTRPEAIKLAPVVNIFKKDLKHFETMVLVTAQHREMLDQVLKVFNIVPDFDLDLMSKNQSLESLTGKILKGVSRVLEKTRPDLVFTQGDTTTTFAASLAAFYKQIPVGHIEAGLRTNNIYSPFPEEINRRMTSSIATFHFPPTEQSKSNLLNERVEDGKIKVSGNTVIDALLLVSEKVDAEITEYENDFLNKYNIEFTGKFTILVTGHRRESFGSGFRNICKAIKSIATNNPEVQIIYPVHLNPHVQKPVNELLSKTKNIHLISPQDYIPFIFLMKKADIILTDSGGVQEEAPSLGKPVLVMRDTTERPEGVEAGTARLVGTDENSIIHQVEILLKEKKEYEKMAKAVNPYGDGRSSEIIYNYIFKNLIN